MGIMDFLGLSCTSSVGDKPLANIGKNRGCTDVPCCLAFIGFWIAMVAVFAGSLSDGDPDKLIKAVDYRGRICGVSPGVEDRPYGAWPDVGKLNFKVCLEKCEHTKTSLLMSCYSVSPLGGGIVTSPPEITTAYTNRTGADFAVSGLTSSEITDDICPRKFPWAPTGRMLGYTSLKFLHYCLPDPISETVNGTDISIGGIEGFDGASETFSRAIGDIKEAYPYMLASLGIAIAVAFIYTFLMRAAAKFIVWLAVLLIALAGGLIGYALLERANKYEEPDQPIGTENRAKACRITGWCFVVATIIYLLLIVFMRKRINIAVEVVKESARALADMKAMLLFPIWPLLFGCGCFVFFCIAALYLFSLTTVEVQSFPIATAYDEQYCGAAGQPDGCGVQVEYYKQAVTNDGTSNASWPLEDYETTLNSGATITSTGFPNQVWDRTQRNNVAMQFFGLLWNIQFWIYFAYFVVAGAVADWYFTRRVDGKKKRGDGEDELTNSPVIASVKRLVRYHLGTIAFGAVLIAIVQFLRAMVHYFEQQTKGQDNKVKKALFCLLKCCLKCAECCLDKLSKNGFIWCAIYGDCFLSAGFHSFKLLWRNLARVAAINLVGDFLMFLGKVFVALVTMAIAALMMDQDEDISSPVIPAIICFMLAYMVGSLFMVLYETAMDTIFMCFLIDEECNKDGEMFASKGLLTIINKYSKDSKELADQRKEAAGEPVSAKDGQQLAV